METVRLDPEDDGDLARVAGFLAACHGLDPAIHDLNQAELAAWAVRARPHLIGAPAGGDLVAFGYATESWCGRERRHFLHVRVFVDPRRRREGLGSRVLRALSSLPIQGDRPGVQSSVPSTWTAAGPFYARLGFRPALVDLEMRRAQGPVEECPAPPGIAIRPLDAARDSADVIRVHHAAYAADPTFDDLTPESLAALAALEGFSMLGAFAGDVLVGFVQTIAPDGGTRAHVESLAVHPDSRARGIGAALLAAALSAKGESIPFGLDVHADNPARRLYERAGFTEIGREVLLRRDLPLD